MLQAISTGGHVPAPDFQEVFNAIPGYLLLLQPNPPHYTILAVSDEQLQITQQERQEVLGKSLFDVYPESPEADTASGISRLKVSLQNAINNKTPDQMPAIRYDVMNAAGIYEERYWMSKNKPFLDAEGNVLYILHTSHEITEQVLAENKANAMRDIEKKYSLFMQAPVAVCILKGPENRVELANEALLRIFNRTSNIIGKPFFDAIPEAKVKGLCERLEMVRKTGKSHDAGTFPVKLEIGGKQEVRHYEFFCQPYFENPGDREAVGALSVWHDVTDQVLARKRVEESEQQVRSFIESSHHPIGVYMGREMRIQFANQALKDGLGKGNDIVGKIYKEVLPELENQQVFEQLEAVYETGVPFQAKNHRLELVVDGELREFYFDFSFTPLFNAAGEVYGVINTGADVTEQVLASKLVEQSARDLQNMANAMPQLVWIAEPSGAVTYYNNRVSDFSGTMQQPDGTWRWESMLIGEDEQRTVEAWNKAMREGTLYEIEHRLRMRDGSYRWHLSRALPQRDSGGNVTRWFGTATDVHERKEQQEALEASNVHLTRINNDLDNFIYTASHDLKAPITNIEGLLLLLSKEYTALGEWNSDTEKILELMKDSVDRFKRTIHSLTDIAKLQNENEYNAVLVNVAEVIEEVTLDLAPLIESTHVALQTDVAPCASIRFSRKNLRSVIYNLLSNALKYRSPDRVLQVKISCLVAGRFHVLTVADNGLGMAPSQTAALFTMFKRFHDHVEGTGIGLYMVKKIVDNASGRIEVESEENVGTTFRIYLPA